MFPIRVPFVDERGETNRLWETDGEGKTRLLHVCNRENVQHGVYPFDYTQFFIFGEESWNDFLPRGVVKAHLAKRFNLQLWAGFG